MTATRDTVKETVDFLRRELDEPEQFIPAEVSANAHEVLVKRYLLRNDDGDVVEDVQQMWRRVADAVAEGDRLHGANRRNISKTADEFYRMMASLDFLPNSPTIMNAGTSQGTLSACFVLPLDDTMEGIVGASRSQAMVQKFGGGTGFALSELRPKGSPISTTHGKACGPVATLRYLSATSKLVTQGGKRDGANMAVMDIHHPDIEEFIQCKSVEGDIHNFNISVGVSDEFMQAVEQGTEYPLRFRADAADADSQSVDVGTLDARSIFDKIVDGAWRNGEPGMIFLDEVNRNSPVAHVGTITATNPCGEQPLLPNESCNLGSINLANYVVGTPAQRLIARTDMQEDVLKPEFAGLQSSITDDLPKIDWARLGETVKLAVHFLDNTIDVNHYALPEIRDMNLLTRKIGLGVMGFADMLARLGIAYDSEFGRTIGRDVMRFVKDAADEASRELAEERGAYGAWSEAAQADDAPMRNACRLTVAPTGTISMIASCSSGIEPLFALAYTKQNILGGDVQLKYLHAGFEQVAEQRGFLSDELIDALCAGESLQDLDEVPDDVKSLFHVSSDISPPDHVLMQAAFQESVDAGISKTINFPESATHEDVRDAYMTAWKTSCKGITVYRAGSRFKEVLTKGTASSASDDTDASAESGEHAPGSNGYSNGTAMQHAGEPQFVQPHTLVDAASLLMNSDSYMKPADRPESLLGRTVQMETGRGRLYITLNYTPAARLFEVFISHGKAGGNDAAMAEALSRLVTMNLRCGVDPFEVAKTMRNIADKPVYSKGRQILSVPDAVAQVIEQYARSPLSDDAADALLDSESLQRTMFHARTENSLASPSADVPSGKVDAMPVVAADSCPQCYTGLAFEEGCKKCYGCGWSEC